MDKDTKKVASWMVDGDAPSQKVAAYVNGLLLRMFAVPSLIAYLKDVSTTDTDVELVFNKLPDEIIAEFNTVTGVPVKPFIFMDNGRKYTGFRVSYDSIPDEEAGDELDANREITAARSV